jgi:hypothetical protein
MIRRCPLWVENVHSGERALAEAGTEEDAGRLKRYANADRQEHAPPVVVLPLYLKLISNENNILPRQFEALTMGVLRPAAKNTNEQEV